MLVRIAWRNLWRNSGRTGIVASTIAFSYGLMLFAFGIGSYSQHEMREATVAAAGGHLLVHGEGYWELPTGGQRVEDPVAVRAALGELSGVKGVAERVIAYGLLSASGAGEGAQLMGVRPEEEGLFYDLEGSLLRGEFFKSALERPVVIGAAQAQELAVGVGDSLTITATGLDGEAKREVFNVSGILESAPGRVGEGRAYIELGDAQELLGYGGAVTQVGALFRNEKWRGDGAAKLKEELAGQNLEVLSWDEAVPELVAILEFDTAFSYLYLFMIMVIVALGITNTFLMALMERVREIGLLSALGLDPRRIGELMMLETVFLAGISMAAGFLLGLAGHFYVATYGIDLSSVMDLDFDLAGVSLDFAVIRSHLDPGQWIMGSVVVFFFICASALYPAWRATKLAPSEAMRFYE